MPQNNLKTCENTSVWSLVTVTMFAVLLSGCVNLRDDPGRRTPGVLIDDAVLEGLVEREIRKSDSGYKGSHIVVVAYNGVILLAGQVPSDELKQNASGITQTMRRVKRVHNELTVGGPISFFARSNDAWLTSKVKSRLIAAKGVKGTKIKVVTENGVVYLMGLVNRSQADLAVQSAAQVYGVQKIVKVFEYLD
ncbi:MAG: BON domain-containing protein [Pseudomonadota bacterium]